MTQPFDDIRVLFEQFAAPNHDAADQVLARDEDLDGLAAIAAWIATWRGGPQVNRPILSIYAGAHAGGDVAAARRQLEAIASGAAPVSRAVQHLGAGLDVFDLALERPVGDAAKAATMSERECAATMAFGMEALAKQPDLLILSGFGPGAETAAANLLTVLENGEGAGAADRARAEAAGDPLQALRQVGGRETAALAGAILAARIQGVPVLLDGAPALAAAAVLHAVDPQAVIHCRLGGGLHDPTVARLAARLGLAPILGLWLPLSDGTASMAALSLVRLAVAVADGAPPV